MQRKPSNAIPRSAGLNIRAVARGSDSYQVASVSKALELLSCFSIGTPVWSLSDLARRADVPKSTAHNLLRTLKRFDLVRQNSETKQYEVGPRALELGLSFVRNSGVVAQVRPTLRRLMEATGETCKFGMLSNDQVVIVAASESSFQLHTRGDVGTRWDLHSTSLGKAILAALSDDEAREIMGRRGMPAHTRNTISAWEPMQAELAAIRQRGYALDLEENEPGVRCVAVAVADPLRDSVISCSASGPRERMPDERIPEIARCIQSAVQKLNHFGREDRA